ncbi:hypothetical protein SAMN04488018_10682 [Myroides marinus]|uniref:Uncharacterized protein n=1 Tax=Myroides marinus TaxID=703342 RepID=A0A1H6U731_9FLAO|nr:hypothetical protein SAMN04488018_10682 [Myroides marinus]
MLFFIDYFVDCFEYKKKQKYRTTKIPYIGTTELKPKNNAK